MKTELSMSVEDLTSGRAQIIDDDDDDHDDHDDSDKINDAEGMDPERLKAFNVSNPPNCCLRNKHTYCSYLWLSSAVEYLPALMLNYMVLLL